MPVDVLSGVRACYACTWAKKPMQRLQGLSQPLRTSKQLWPIISMDFILFYSCLQHGDIPVTLDLFTRGYFYATKEAACSPAEYCIWAVLDPKMSQATLQYLMG